MRAILASMAVAAAVASAQPASAQQTYVFFTGGRLHEECKNDQNWCQAYILGVVDGMTAYPAYTDSPRILCILEGTDPETLVDLVLAYLEANPDEWQYDAPSQVVLALLDKHGCKRD